MGQRVKPSQIHELIEAQREAAHNINEGRTELF